MKEVDELNALLNKILHAEQTLAGQAPDCEFAKLSEVLSKIEAVLKRITSLDSPIRYERGMRQNRPRILLLEFCEKLEQLVFGVQFPDSTQLIKMTAKEILCNQDLLHGLSAKAVAQVCYVLADELMLAEKKVMHTLKVGISNAECLK